MSKPDYESMKIRDLKALLLLRGVDPSQCVEKKDLVATARKLDSTDYDEEARKLFASLNLTPAPKSHYSALDAMWRDPDSGGKVYVGNAVSASTLRTLRDHEITYVVNCQDSTSQNYFEDDPGMTYLRFPVAYMRPDGASVVRRAAAAASEGRSDGGVGAGTEKRGTGALDGFRPTFDFIDGAVAGGGNVLVHCLAGAHRAGTVGCAYLMYKLNLGVDDALRAAKAMRPIIAPFGMLMEILRCLEHDLQQRRLIDGESAK